MVKEGTSRLILISLFAYKCLVRSGSLKLERLDFRDWTFDVQKKRFRTPDVGRKSVAREFGSAMISLTSGTLKLAAIFSFPAPTSKRASRQDLGIGSEALAFTAIHGGISLGNLSD